MRARSNRLGWLITPAIVTVAVVASAGCAGGGGDSSAQATTEPPPPSGQGYDVAGRDIPAICKQLKVFAERWDADVPAGATEQEKGAIAQQAIVEMTAAAAELHQVAPAGLAQDATSQAAAAQSMVAQFLPSASVTASAPSGPPKDLRVVGEEQRRIDAFAQPTCGFKIWG